MSFTSRRAFVTFIAVIFACGPVPAAIPPPAPPPVTATNAMVVTNQRDATRAGIDVLRNGGNAVDAAVAVAYALAVVDPCCGNLGGGGFMLIHLAARRGRAARDTFVNFRETAPAAATRDMFLDGHGNVVPGRSTKGWLAVAVPGTVMGLERARSEYGTRSLAKLIAPAIGLARNGYVLSGGDARIYERATPHFLADPELRQTFTHDGRPLQAGERFRQPVLAATLDRIARNGVDAFYRGPIARSLVIASAQHGGILARDDLARYHAEELAPVRCTHHSYTIVTAPPPRSPRRCPGRRSR